MMHEIGGDDNHEDVNSLISHAKVPESTGSSGTLAQEAEYLTASIARIMVYIFRLRKLSPDESD
jgi:hypothetical protein